MLSKLMISRLIVKCFFYFSVKNYQGMILDKYLHLSTTTISPQSRAYYICPNSDLYPNGDISQKVRRDYYQAIDKVMERYSPVGEKMLDKEEIMVN